MKSTENIIQADLMYIKFWIRTLSYDLYILKPIKESGGKKRGHFILNFFSKYLA